MPLPLPELKSENNKALYVQIAEALAEMIHSGEWCRGDRLPSQNDLMKRYGVSQATVRQALLNLSNDGLVAAHQGKGVFVTNPRLKADLSRPNLLSRSGGSESFEYEFLSAELLFAPERVASLLELQHHAQITRTRRKLRAGLQLIGMETANFPVSVVQLFSRDDLHDGDYLAVLGRMPEAAVRSIDLSVSAGCVTEFDADLLDIPRDSIVLQRIEVARRTDRKPVMMTRTVLLADQVDLASEILLADN